jgi:hypothetical protein
MGMAPYKTIRWAGVTFSNGVRLARLQLADDGARLLNYGHSFSNSLIILFSKLPFLIE